ncbi:MAG: DUF3810 domain-containing protein [Lachnospiraceae bacterium]
MKKKRLYGPFAVFVIALILNILSWVSTVFCDWYLEVLFPIINGTYGRIFSFFPFSVGEIMIIVGIIWLIIAVFVEVFAHLYKRKNNKIFKYYRKSVAWILSIIFLIQTLNCFILYHVSDFGSKYDLNENEVRTLEDLIYLRNYIVERANDLATYMERDENGNVIYNGDMEEVAIKSMKKLGESYPVLDGFYSTPKALISSPFISQQYMQGYYFPFSLEANYNDVMYITNIPATMCHELAHTKGVLYEDEANLISFLACIRSDDLFFQYSGYLSVLNYIDSDFYNSINKNKEIYYSYEKISSLVKKDNVFLTKEAWNEVEKKSVVKTEKVKEAAQTFVDVTLLLNGISDGSLSYGRVVSLLISYYDDEFSMDAKNFYLASKTY